MSAADHLDEAATAVLENTVQTALGLGHDDVGTEHLPVAVRRPGHRARPGDLDRDGMSPTVVETLFPVR